MISLTVEKHCEKDQESVDEEKEVSLIDFGLGNIVNLLIYDGS